MNVYIVKLYWSSIFIEEIERYYKSCKKEKEDQRVKVVKSVPSIEFLFNGRGGESADVLKAEGTTWR